MVRKVVEEEEVSIKQMKKVKGKIRIIKTN